VRANLVVALSPALDQHPRLFQAVEDLPGQQFVSQLYRVEETIGGALPGDRRRERQRQSKPIATALRAWAQQTAPKLSRKSELAAAFR
jgi:hypothetical protein